MRMVVVTVWKKECCVLKKALLPYLCDNLCCKIFPKNRILVLLVVRGEEKHVLSLNQFASFISKELCKTEVNYVSLRTTR